MNALGTIIKIMSDDDISAFSVYMNKRNKRYGTHNLKLLRALKNDDIKSLEKLKTTIKTSGAYHALSKRLYDSIIEFMANRSFEKDTSAEHEVLRLLVISRVFLEHKLEREAFKCLAKAESKALALEHYSLLGEIYHTQIQYAHLNPVLSLEDVIKHFMANKERLHSEEQLNLAYAVLRRELANIYHKGKIASLQETIKHTMDRFGINIQEVLTFKSLYQILFIANEYASINNNYTLIEQFAAKSYAFINARQELAGRHLYYHIYILYFIANINFRNRKFALAEEYLDMMFVQMQQQDQKYYRRFCLRYYLLLALNYNYSGNPGRAVDIAERALIAYKEADPNDVNDLRLSLVVFHLQQDNGRDAGKHMRELIHTDGWYEKKMGRDWAIKRSMIEILLHVQQQNYELALSLLTAFKRRYAKYLNEVGESRVMAYMGLIERYANKPEIIAEESFRSSLTKLMEPLKGTNEDVFVISFLGWLLAKVKNKLPYNVTLELMESYNSPSHSA